MIEIEQQPWNGHGPPRRIHLSQRMLRRHAGPHRGREEDCHLARFRSRIAFAGEQGERYELRPEDLLGRRQSGPRARLDLIGIFHSHPDCDAYFSETDLKNSCPWYSFVVLSIQNGKFDHANSFCPTSTRPKRRKKN